LVEGLESRWLLTILTVTSPSDSGAGSLRAVIVAAQSGDTIVFSPALFSSAELSSPTKRGQGKGRTSPPTPPPPPNTITLTSGQLTLTRNLTIQGPGADQLTVSGNYNSRVFEVSQGVTVTLSGMTITQSSTAFIYGGGILNNGALTVSKSTVAGNGALYGGGIYNAGGTLVVGDSTLGGNYADGIAGGGIYNAGGTVAVSSSTLFNNTSQYGGGIYNSGGTLSITNSTLSGNSARADYNGAGGDGGAIYNRAGMVTLINSSLSGNSASRFGFAAYGGGIYNAADGTVTIKSSSSITGNFGFEDVNNLGVLYMDNTSTIGVLVGNPPSLI
jgi:hypothetical protein